MKPKQALTIITLLCCLHGRGQSPNIARINYYSIADSNMHIADVEIFDSLGHLVASKDNGRWTITNDTVALEMMFNAYNRLDSSLNKQWKDIDTLYETVKASVKFINCIPDYWKEDKNNCMWQPYWKLLKQLGWESTKSKTPLKLNPCKP
jgi:hypothetical protein